MQHTQLHDSMQHTANVLRAELWCHTHCLLQERLQGLMVLLVLLSLIQ